MKHFNSWRLPVLVCAVFMGLYRPAHAQTTVSDWQIGFGAGYTNYYGDVSNYRISKLKDIGKLYKFADYNKYYTDQPSLSVLAQKRITPTLGFMVQVNTLSFSMSDRYRSKNGVYDLSARSYPRALNFRTSVQDAGIAFTFKSNNGRFLSEQAFFYPSFFIGMGVSRFTVKGDQYDASNQRYDYRLVGNIQDGNFETNLRDIHTETTNSYSNIVPYADLGLGLNFRVSSMVRLSVQSDIKYSASDYLDDVSGQYKATYASPEEQYVAKPGLNTVDPLTRQRGDNNGVHDVYINNRVILSIGLNKKKTQKPFTPPAVYSLSVPYRAARADTVARRAVVRRDSVLHAKEDSLAVLAHRNDSLMRVIDTTTRMRQSMYAYQADSMKAELQTIQAELKDIKNLLKDQQVKPRSQQLQYQADSLRSLQNKISSQRTISREDNLRLRIYQLQTDSIHREMEKVQERTEGRPVQEVRIDTVIRKEAVIRDTVINKTGQREIDSLESKLNELERRIQERNNRDTVVYNQRQEAEKTAAYNRTVDSEAVNRNITQLEDRIKVSNDSVSYLKKQLQHAADSAAYYNRLVSTPVGDEATRQEKKARWYQRVFQSRKAKNKEEVKELEKEVEKDRLEEQQKYYRQQADRTNQQVEELQRRNKDLSDQYNDLVTSRNSRRTEGFQVQAQQPAVIYQNDASRRGNFTSQEYNELQTLRTEMARLRDQVNDANQRNYNTVPVTALQPVAPAPVTIVQPVVPVTAPVVQQQPAAAPAQVIRDTVQIELLRTDLERLRSQLDSLRTVKPVVATREVITDQKFDVKSFPVVSVYFRSGSAVLTNDQIKKITPYAQVAVKNPDAKVLLKGFTDPTGNPAVNQAIAKKRSDFVKDILKTRFNINESRIVADEPVLGETDRNKKPNPLDRRVDLEFN